MRVWSTVPDQSGFTDFHLRPPETPSDEMSDDIWRVFGLDPPTPQRPLTYQPSYGQYSELSNSSAFGATAADLAVHLEWEQDALEPTGAATATWSQLSGNTEEPQSHPQYPLQGNSELPMAPTGPTACALAVSPTETQQLSSNHDLPPSVYMVGISEERGHPYYEQGPDKFGNYYCPWREYGCKHESALTAKGYQ